MNNKYQRRVVTKLPFADKGEILEKTNGGIWIKGGHTYYGTYSTSDNAVTIFNHDDEQKLVETLWDNSEWLEEIGEVSAFVKNNNKDEIVIKLDKTVSTDTLDTLGKFIQQVCEKHLAEHYKSKGHKDGCPIIIK